MFRSFFRLLLTQILSSSPILLPFFLYLSEISNNFSLKQNETLVQHPLRLLPPARDCSTTLLLSSLPWVFGMNKLLFSSIHPSFPCTFDGMDIYSTLLFHLKKDMKLSYLAQDLISIDRLSPQAWCAMGNCYSLLKDHETALKNFLRAVQLDSRFAYAHMLCGHEYIAMEDFDNGIKCYQYALEVDDRHYNAWYGLGVVYLRQEKFDFAEHHFRRAFQINRSSSIIMCYLGMALHQLKRNGDALEMIEKAITADRKNPLPVYQKASILLSLGRCEEALENLEQVKEFAPHESGIYALIAKIYKRLNMHDKAMFYFGIALDLKPPATDIATIKSAMEKLNLPDEFEDTM